MAPDSFLRGTFSSDPDAMDATPTPPGEPAGPPVRHRETLRWNDADLQGVVNNSITLTLFEQSRFTYFRALGLLESSEFPFLLGRSEVRWERPTYPGDTVDVLARITRLGGASFDMAYEVRRGDETVSRGDATLVWIGPDGKSSEIPSGIRARIAEFEGIETREGVR